MKKDAIHTYAAIVGILAGITAIALAFYIHSAQPKLGPSWHIAGILLTSPRLLAAMGVVMVIGGVLTFWSPAGGGLLVLVPAVIGLIYCYDHEWTRIPLLKIWAAPMLLAWLAGVLAGYALAKDVPAHDEPPDYGDVLTED
jgi:hypothetical protein